MNNKSPRIFTFTFLLTTIFLLSLTFETIVWAKPNKPNKPDIPPGHQTNLISDFKIWIGNGNLGSPEDVVLRPYGYPEIDYLLKEDWPYWEPSWLLYTKKGEGHWNINFHQGMPPGTQEYCGTYDIANKLGGPGYEEVALFDTMAAHGFSNGLEARQLSLTHITPKRSRVEDYWGFVITWKVGEHLVLGLSGVTDEDAVWEGAYDQDSDTWTVAFDNEWFELVKVISDDDDTFDFGNDVPITLWEGPLSFTLKIQRK